METFRLDKYGDVVILSNEMQMVEDKEELAQAVWLTLSINKGEWFLDNELGLDYTVFMEDKFYSETKIAREIEETILQDNRVTFAEITEIELDRLKRKIKIKGYATDKEQGRIAINEVIQIG